MKAYLKFESPFIVGGNNITNNHIESLDYIQGNIIRAALAKYILQNCKYHVKGDKVIVDGVERYNWVYFRDKEHCVNCKFKDLCKGFSKMKVTFFYPKGASIIPLTAMICKKTESHGFIDCMVNELKCKKCRSGDNRVEGITGYIKDGQVYGVTKTFFTRTAINKYTNTSKQGSLYSLIAVSATENNERGISENIYEGYIENIDKNAFINLKSFYIGKYNSVGLGKCSITLEHENKCDENKVIKSMKKFSKEYKKFNKIKEEKNIIALKLEAPARLENIKNLHGYFTTEEYKKKWHEFLNLHEDFSIEQVYTDIVNFRGYDFSKGIGNEREEPILMAVKGSVFVLSCNDSFENIYKRLKDIGSLGSEGENGFGKFSFYFGGVING